MYKVILMVLSGLILSACSSTDSSGVYMSTNVNISFVSPAGEDLIASKAITDSNTDLYYLKNGNKTKYYKSNLDNPNGISILDPHRTPSKYYAMRILPNIIYSQNHATTYIHFSDGSVDTLKVQYKGNNGIAVTKVWYNQKLKWDVSDKDQPYFKITKKGMK